MTLLQWLAAAKPGSPRYSEVDTPFQDSSLTKPGEIRVRVTIRCDTAVGCGFGDSIDSAFGAAYDSMCEAINAHLSRVT